MTTLRPFPDNFDPYGKDFTKPTTGQDNIFRFRYDKAGYVAGAVTSLTPEEAKKYRDDQKPTVRVRKRNKKQETA